MSLPENHNEIDSAIAEAKAPAVYLNVGVNPYLILQDGYVHHDMENSLPAPTRKRGKIALDDANSFCSYLNKHGDEEHTVIYCMANYGKGEFAMTGVLNDHGDDQPAWRDHTCDFKPKLTEEWARWFTNSGKRMSQLDFAAFIEENMRDITSAQVDESPNSKTPTGSAMLEMALSLEANNEVKFKSAARLTDGGVSLTFINQADEGTAKQMAIFERFSLGIAPFFNGDPYRLDARLRYRLDTNAGKLTFWYELVRPDKVLEDAAKSEVTKIKALCPDFLILYGSAAHR